MLFKDTVCPAIDGELRFMFTFLSEKVFTPCICICFQSLWNANDFVICPVDLMNWAVGKSLCLSLLASFSQCLLLISGLSVYFDTFISAADFIPTFFISLRVVFPFLRLVGVHTVRYAPQSAPNQWLFCFYVVNNTGCFLFGLLPISVLYKHH